MLSRLQNTQCSFYARGHNFQRNDIPTETSEVIYQLDDYRSCSSISVISVPLFTFSYPLGHSVWGIAEKERSIFLHQIPLFQFGKLCCHFIRTASLAEGKVCNVDETIYSDRTETAK